MSRSSCSSSGAQPTLSVSSFETMRMAPRGKACSTSCAMPSITDIDFDIPTGKRNGTIIRTWITQARGLNGRWCSGGRYRIQEGEGRLQVEEELRGRKIRATSRTLPGRLDPEIGD